MLERPRLVVLFGPPAVGKMTVARSLADRTGFRLFHNHMTVDPLSRLFPVDSPALVPVLADVRVRVFEALSEAAERGVIFTFVWDLDDSADRAFIERTIAAFGGLDRVSFVELAADRDERLRRNASPHRLAEKWIQRDVEGSRAFLIDADGRYRMNSSGDFPFPDRHLTIDNTELEPDAVAEQITRHFDLQPDPGGMPSDASSPTSEIAPDELRALPTSVERIRAWRQAYRREMSCQIIHDSIHDRSGFTHEYLLSIRERSVGYASVAVAGPWRDEPILYEIYVEPAYRTRLLDLAAVVLLVSRAPAINVQSNDSLGTVVIQHHARHIKAQAILFGDSLVTDFCVGGATFRHPTAAEAPEASEDERRWRGVIALDGRIAATGGVLFHYNPPYGDIYMDVEEPYRRRGLGTLMVQELKRLCHTRGFRPAARCSPSNLASRRTLQKAGFAPCGHILKGLVK